MARGHVYLRKDWNAASSVLATPLSYARNARSVDRSANPCSTVRVQSEVSWRTARAEIKFQRTHSFSRWRHGPQSGRSSAVERNRNYGRWHDIGATAISTIQNAAKRVIAYAARPFRLRTSFRAGYAGRGAEGRKWRGYGSDRLQQKRINCDNADRDAFGNRPVPITNHDYEQLADSAAIAMGASSKIE